MGGHWGRWDWGKHTFDNPELGYWMWLWDDFDKASFFPSLYRPGRTKNRERYQSEPATMQYPGAYRAAVAFSEDFKAEHGAIARRRASRSVPSRSDI